MASERHVRLFTNGRTQAVRIPREFAVAGAYYVAIHAN